MALTKKNFEGEPDKDKRTEEVSKVYRVPKESLQKPRKPVEQPETPEEGGSEPKIVRPYDDEVVDPFSGDDVELRDPWSEGNSE